MAKTQEEKDAAKALKEAEKAEKAAADAAAKNDGADDNDAEPAVQTKGRTVGTVARKAHWPKGFVPTGDRKADTKTLLDAEPKVSFICPLGPEEKAGAEEIVQINGYTFIIKKGHMVEIPNSVAQMLANKYRVEVEVAQRASALAKPELS